MKKVLILFGGPTNEHLISCRSAKNILENIDYKKYNVSTCGISEDNSWYQFNDTLDLLDNGNWRVSSNNEKIENIVEYIKDFDVVFPIIHGTLGEDGKLASMFDMFNISYIGSNCLAHALGYDKYYTKLICSNLDIEQIEYVVLNKGEKKYTKIIEEKLGYPVIIKPCCSGSSIGINVANNKKELAKYIKDAFAYDNKVIIEKYIKNRREFECGILEDKKIIASTIGEIIIDNGFYDYDSKYVNKSNIVIPAFISDEIETMIKNTSTYIFKILGCKSLARVDFIYDEDNDVLYFNEINTMPGFTDISMYSKVFDYDGISYKDLITKLIENAKKE